MVIAGQWIEQDDGEVRPIVRIAIEDDSRRGITEDFLIDTGADFTVLTASAAAQFEPSTSAFAENRAVAGVGGFAEARSVSAVLALTNAQGQTARFHGDYAAFLDADASDISILGRDILDHFDTIVSRRTDQIMLLFAGSGFTVHPG